MEQKLTGQAAGLPCSGEMGVPRHIAIIMDGNGRWATRRGLPRTAGHKAGAETFRRIATYCKKIGVQYLTVYAFSTENWKRSESEVGAIMLLLKKYLLEAVDTMERDHIRLHFFGDMTPIAPELRALAHETDEITEHLSKDDFQANVCLNYGGRDEILRAVRRFAADCAAGEKRPEDLDERTQKETSYDQYMLQHNYVGALCLGFTLTDTWLYQMRSSRTPSARRE